MTTNTQQVEQRGLLGRIEDTFNEACGTIEDWTSLDINGDGTIGIDTATLSSPNESAGSAAATDGSTTASDNDPSTSADDPPTSAITQFLGGIHDIQNGHPLAGLFQAATSFIPAMIESLQPQQLFVDGISASDCVQGASDCFLMSSLASIAEADPEAIRNMITDNGDGTYTVRFYQDGDINNPVYVTVTGPSSFEDGAYRPDGEIWPAVVESAYVVFVGGTAGQTSAALGPDGICTYAGEDTALTMAELTGRDCSRIGIKPGSMTGDELFNYISAAIDNDSPIIAGTGKDASAEGLAQNHVYSVLDTRTLPDGTQQVELRNPWGFGEPGNDGADNGVFWMDIETFQANFNNIVSAEPVTGHPGFDPALGASTPV